MSLLCRWTSGFVQFLDKVVDMPVMSTTVVLLTVEVPQIQFIAGVRGHSCCATETGTMFFSSGGYGGEEGFFGLSGRFSRSSRLSQS